MTRIIQEGHLHLEDSIIAEKVEGLYHIIPFHLLRQTPNVNFHSIPMMDKITGIERVMHAEGALSPGSVGDVKNPWYMHPSQEDNLITLYGTRLVELYHKDFEKIYRFEISADDIKLDGKVIYDGPAILGWPTGVFHRNSSPFSGGSGSLNLGIQFSTFDVKYEFNIYDIDVKTGEHRVIREGFLDQPTTNVELGEK